MGKKILPRTSVKPTGIKILLWGLVIVIAMTILARFNVLPAITAFQSDVLTLIAILFVATEIGLMGMIRRKKKLDGISVFGGLIVAAAFLGLILSWFGVIWSALESIQGFVSIALLAYVVIEIFRK